MSVVRRITSLTYTPVKGTSLVQPKSVELAAGGIPEDRLFHLLDATTCRQIGASPKLLPITSRYLPDTGRLAVQLPTGERAEAPVVLGDQITAKIGWDQDRPMDSRLVIGPWPALLSTYLGHHVLLAQVLRPEGAVDVAPITLVSTRLDLSRRASNERPASRDRAVSYESQPQRGSGARGRRVVRAAARGW